MKKSLNPTLVYVLSILGLLCCCFGGVGVFISGGAFLMANKKIKAAQLNPDEFDGSINAISTAKTFALIVLIINILCLLWTAYIVATGDWSAFYEEWQNAMEEFNKKAEL